MNGVVRTLLLWKNGNGGGVVLTFAGLSVTRTVNGVARESLSTLLGNRWFPITSGLLLEWKGGGFFLDRGVGLTVNGVWKPVAFGGGGGGGGGGAGRRRVVDFEGGGLVGLTVKGVVVVSGFVVVVAVTSALLVVLSRTVNGVGLTYCVVNLGPGFSVVAVVVVRRWFG